MANQIFRGDAPAIAQVQKLTPGNIGVGDVFRIKINGKTVAEHTATTTTAASVVDALVAAWNASNISEATEITALDAGDYLTLTADVAGVPFRIEAEAEDATNFVLTANVLQEGGPDVNEVQSIVLPTATGGTFTITFSGYTTGNLAYNIAAASLETALEGLTSIGASNVSVSGSAGEYEVTFIGALAATNVPVMKANGSNLTGGHTVDVDEATTGSASQNEIHAIDVSDYTGESSALLQIDLTADFGAYTRNLSYQFWSSDISTLNDNLAEAWLNEWDLSGVTILESNVGNVWSFEYTGALAGISITGSCYPLATFTPQLLTRTQQGSATGINEVQTITLTGGANGGTFTLTFDGDTTSGLAWDVSAAALQTALEGLTSIGSGNVAVTGGDGGPWTITFQGTLAATDVSLITGNATSLTGGNVYITTTTTGAAGTNEKVSLSISPTPTGGTFTLTVDLGSGDETTASLDYDASAAEVLAALEGLTSAASGDFTVTGSDGGPWTVTFIQNFAKTAIDPITGTMSSLTATSNQTLTVTTTQRSRGPNHWDDPLNWTGGNVPNTGDSVFFGSSAPRVNCLYGLRQATTFTADAGTDTLTFDGGISDFLDDQTVKVATSDTLPAGLSGATTYYLINVDRDAGTCQLSTSEGGSAVNITDAGTGTHTIRVELTVLNIAARWNGLLGLSERNSGGGGYYEYRDTDLQIGAATVKIGEGEGPGSGRINLNLGSLQSAITVADTGGSVEADRPAVHLLTNNSSTTLEQRGGEVGLCLRATETFVIGSVTNHQGSFEAANGTIATYVEHAGIHYWTNVTVTNASDVTVI